MSTLLSSVVCAVTSYGESKALVNLQKDKKKLFEGEDSQRVFSRQGFRGSRPIVSRYITNLLCKNRNMFHILTSSL